MIKNWAIALFIYPVMMLSACAQNEVNSEDTQFLVVGKTANYRQVPTGEQTMINYHFY